MQNDIQQKLGSAFQSGRGLLGEFRTFITRGNVVQLAVAVIIGAAFTKVVEAFTKGFVEPILGMFSKNHDLSFLNFGGFGFGTVLGAFLNFLITAGVVFFFIIKPMNKFSDMLSKKEEEKPAPPAEPSEEILLLREIRDALKR